MSKNKYAVVKLAGKQLKVREGEELTVNRLEHEVGEEFETDQVLLIKKGKKTQVGQPLVKDAKVKFKVLDNFRSKKLKVFKFKAKSRYRRVKGHRQHLSKIEVVSIEG